MKTAYHVETISEYNAGADHPTLHPLVSVLDFANTPPRSRNTPVQAVSFGFYSVFLKNDQSCTVRYGRRTYDYQAGTLLFIAPNQVVSLEDDPDPYQPTGRALLFHPNLLRGTALGQHIRDYTFFSYDVREALHLSEAERRLVVDCLSVIQSELERPIDRYSKKLITNALEFFLNYCMRFYERQFITREQVNQGIVQKFDAALDDYFRSKERTATGPPTVAYCADALNVSTHYFGDLIKKETGKSAREYIQLRLIEIAKERLMSPDKTVNEVAYELGFVYPQHFTRFFKQQVGHTPREYRMNSLHGAAGHQAAP